MTHEINVAQTGKKSVLALSGEIAVDGNDLIDDEGVNATK